MSFESKLAILEGAFDEAIKKIKSEPTPDANPPNAPIQSNLKKVYKCNTIDLYSPHRSRGKRLMSLITKWLPRGQALSGLFGLLGMMMPLFQYWDTISSCLNIASGFQIFDWRGAWRLLFAIVRGEPWAFCALVFIFFLICKEVKIRTRGAAPRAIGISVLYALVAIVRYASYALAAYWVVCLVLTQGFMPHFEDSNATMYRVVTSSHTWYLFRNGEDKCPFGTGSPQWFVFKNKPSVLYTCSDEAWKHTAEGYQAEHLVPNPMWMPIRVEGGTKCGTNRTVEYDPDLDFHSMTKDKPYLRMFLGADMLKIKSLLDRI